MSDSVRLRSKLVRFTKPASTPAAASMSPRLTGKRAREAISVSLIVVNPCWLLLAREAFNIGCRKRASSGGVERLLYQSYPVARADQVPFTARDRARGGERPRTARWPAAMQGTS